MNLSFIIGFVLAVAVLIFGIVLDAGTMTFVFGNLTDFINVPGLLITIGGTIVTLIACFPLSYFANIPSHFRIITGKNKQDPVHYINVMTELSKEARSKGLLALVDSVSEDNDTFLRDSVMMVADAVEPDKVRARLSSELANIENRHAQVWDIYDKGASTATVFGMAGTLIGLIKMLWAANFGGEGGMLSLAQLMAAALLPAVYGFILSNIFFMPVANQLRIAHEREMLCKEIIIEGIISIQAGENPRHIREELSAFVSHKQRPWAGTDNVSG